ncbi:MAG: hypothetical protein EXS32_09335 [Opitutus sp.]|nr:hypothetical protein [Opitutus sp.]
MTRLRRLLPFISACAACTACAEIEFTGLLVMRAKTLFALTETSTGESGWRQQGQAFAGAEITDYDAQDDTLTFTKDGAKIRVRLKDGKVKAGRLEITGSVTLGVGEKMEVVRATLAFDEETVFPLKDGLVCRITPQLRPDGNYLFRSSFERVGADGKTEKLSAPTVVTLPGVPFRIVVGDLGFGFTPSAAHAP